MQINSESCVYVESDDVVYGDQGYANTSQWHEAVYYSSPLDVFDNEADVAYPNGDVYTHNSTYYQDPNLSYECNYYGAPQSPSFSGGYLNQDLSYDYGVYHYQYYPAYYVYPTYPGYYSLTNPQYSPEYLYSAYYVYVPVNIYYYVPDFVHYLPTSANNVNDIIDDVDSTQSNESDVLSSSMEQSFDNSQEFNSNFYDIDNSSEEIVGEEQTTFQLLYEEYPEMLNDAPVDDEEKSEGSNKKLEKDIVANGDEVNECISVGDQSYSIETNVCEDDVDIKLIKKISSMSIGDVKEDIDVNYENAKAFVYNEVLKGYLEIKNQLEELDWECHSLEDILEEEKPESDSSEMDFNESVAEDLENSNLLPVEEEECSSAFVPLSEESIVASSEEALDKDYETMMEEALDKDYGTMMEEAQPSMDLSVVEEKDKTDPFIELSSSEESKVASSEEALDKDYETMMEEAQPSVNLSVVEEKDKTDPFIELSSSEESKVASSEEALDKDYETMMEEAQPSVDLSVVEEKDKTSSKEELYTGLLNTKEDDCASVNSSAVEENDTRDSVLELSLTEEKSDSGSRSRIKETDTKMSSQDRVEERLNFDPDIVAPAASKPIKRKKRFSGLGKFFARMCCCAKKTS